MLRSSAIAAICLSLLAIQSSLFTISNAVTLYYKQQDAGQTEAVQQLALRLLGPDAQRFQFLVSPDQYLPRHNALLTKMGRNKLKIEANSGVAAAWALHHYITEYCSGLVAWSGVQVSLPTDHLPQLLGGRLSLISYDNYTVMPNVCTASYTYAWWNFSRWERHIDWMAMHGVNVAYAQDGQEQVFRNVFLKLGLTPSDVDEFFSGPAFLTWNRMGNLKKFAGPLPTSWYKSQVALQKLIVQRMNQIGIQPVLQGFSGMVPDAFIRSYPKVNYTRLSNWNNFGANYSEVAVIDPQDPIFTNISSLIINETISIFGDVTNFFAMDTFNENQPGRGDLPYLKAVSASIFQGLKAVKPNAIWLLQNWFFGNEAAFWSLDRVQAFLSSVPVGNMLILDMYGDSRGSLASKLNGYFGHNFVSTVLHNFGGNNAMGGSLAALNEHGPWQLREQFANNFLGTGITPEGLMQNEIIYEFALEFSWRRQPVSESYWAKQFSIRRYGTYYHNLVNAWSMLQTSLYNGPSSYQPIALLTRRPSLKASEYVYYDTNKVETAWRLLLQTTDANNRMLIYDQVDLTRQMLQIRFNQYYVQLVQHVSKNDSATVISAAATLEQILIDMDWLLQTDAAFLLQRQIEEAKRFATNSDEMRIYEFNIRNILTVWGYSPYNIVDYCARMYNGLISQYYLPRWQLFFQQLIAAIKSGKQIDQQKFEQQVFNSVEKPFFMSNKPVGPAEPIGDASTAVNIIATSLPPAPAGVNVRALIESFALPAPGQRDWRSASLF